MLAEHMAIRGGSSINHGDPALQPTTSVMRLTSYTALVAANGLQIKIKLHLLNTKTIICDNMFCCCFAVTTRSYN